MTHKLLLTLPTQLETERLLLRAYRKGDGAMYLAVGQNNRSHLVRFESGNSVLRSNTAEEAEVVIREMVLAWEARDYFMFGAFLKSTGQFVAQLYIGVVRWETPEFEIGYFADRGFEGQGYVGEAVKAGLEFAFLSLGAHRVRIECSDLNARSRHVAERCGFAEEAHFIEDKREEDGTFSGTYIFRILRAEWEEQTGRTHTGMAENA